MAGDNPTLSYQPAKQRRQLTHRNLFLSQTANSSWQRKMVPTQEKSNIMIKMDFYFFDYIFICYTIQKKQLMIMEVRNKRFKQGCSIEK
jgi:hypothetical protein